MTQAQLIDSAKGRLGEGHSFPCAGGSYDGGLLPLVPLVKVAWAEGRVTRRERTLIDRVARRHGVEAGCAAHTLLSCWLESKPPEEFFEQSFAHLRSLLNALPEEAREETTLDLISQCTSVAEASGGNTDFPSGGSLICDEEVAAVKGIAANLRRPVRRDFAELLELAEATGVTDANALRGLREIGFTPQTGALLPFVPLVETVWAKGHVSAVERRAVLTAARLQGIRPSSATYEMLVRLLSEKPTSSFFDKSFRALRSVIQILPHDYEKSNASTCSTPLNRRPAPRSGTKYL